MKPGKPARPGAKVKATFNIDEELHRRLKIQAATEGRDMVAILEEAVERHLSLRHCEGQ